MSPLPKLGLRCPPSRCTHSQLGRLLSVLRCHSLLPLPPASMGVAGRGALGTPIGGIRFHVQLVCLWEPSLGLSHLPVFVSLSFGGSRELKQRIQPSSQSKGELQFDVVSGTYFITPQQLSVISSKAKPLSPSSVSSP